MDKRYCYEKCFKQNIVTAPIHIQKPLLKAMWEGDGSDSTRIRKGSKERTRVYASTSKLLALQVQIMLLRQNKIYGIKPVKYKSQHSKGTSYHVSSVVNQRDRYSFIEDDVMWTKIRKAKSCGKHETYNLSVRGNPNYITPIGIVHNCGTMQSEEDRIEASVLYPEWKEWINELEEEVLKKYPWKWGHEQPQWYKDLKNGQMGIFGEHEKYDHQFQPMCIDCKINEK